MCAQRDVRVVRSHAPASETVRGAQAGEAAASASAGGAKPEAGGPPADGASPASREAEARSGAGEAGGAASGAPPFTPRPSPHPVVRSARPAPHPGMCRAHAWGCAGGPPRCFLASPRRGAAHGAAALAAPATAARARAVRQQGPRGRAGAEGSWPVVLDELLARVLHCCYADTWPARCGGLSAVAFLARKCACSALPASPGPCERAQPLPNCA